MTRTVIEVKRYKTLRDGERWALARTLEVPVWDWYPLRELTAPRRAA